MEARDAVAALARHVVLKVPDKADFRGLAAAAAAELVAELPTAHQHAFVVFAARLSRSTKARCPLKPLTLAAAVSSCELAQHTRPCEQRLTYRSPRVAPKLQHAT